MKLSNILTEALEKVSINYKGSRDNYNIHDKNPNIILLDPEYKGDSYLAFNINYLTKEEKKKLMSRIQRTDNKILMGDKDLKDYIEGFLSPKKSDAERKKSESEKKKDLTIATILNKGIYPNGKDIKIARYKGLTRKHPELLKIIRRYKKGFLTVK